MFLPDCTLAFRGIFSSENILKIIISYFPGATRFPYYKSISSENTFAALMLTAAEMSNNFARPMRSGGYHFSARVDANFCG